MGRMNTPWVVGLGVLMCSGAALAAPRDTVTLTNVNSDIPNTSGSGTLAVAVPYTAKFVRVQGSLTKIASATFAREASVLMFLPTAGGAAVQVVAPTEVTTYASTLGVDSFLRLSAPVPLIAGSTTVQALELFKDAASGPDQRWTTLTVTLNDGPPPALNLGPIEPRTVSKFVTLISNAVRWFRFDLATPINGAAFLDIDTFGSAIGPGGVTNNENNDTVLVLYDDNGQVVARNDDVTSYAGPVAGTAGYRQSLLSFGAGGGATPVAGLTATGQSGILAAGTYWLSVRGFSGGSTESVGWDVTSASTYTGTAKINIRCNTNGSAWCPADWSRDDAYNIDDIFIFLNAWFGGCL